MMTDQTRLVNWAQEILNSNIYTHIRSAPWTSIYKFETRNGAVYLKHCIPGLFIEAQVIQQIEKIAPGKVPSIIAINNDLHCFLMKDAGVPLRSVIKENFNIDLLIQALHQYTDIQIKLSDHVSSLLKLGVPDFRLEHFPRMYHELLHDQQLMHEIGLSAEDIKRFASIDLNPICQHIMSYNIKPSFDQSDFQDNNILWNEQTQRLTHIDLGESTISHPFFALHTFLFMAHFCGYYQKNDNVHQQLIEACLLNFRSFESEENLKKIFELTLRLQPLYYIFSLERCIKLCETQGLRDDFVNSRGIVIRLRNERKNIPKSLEELWINMS